jgi:hypothetical protein
MTWLESAWSGLQDRVFNRQQPDLSPISRGLDAFGHPIYANPVGIDPFDRAKRGLDPETGLPVEYLGAEVMPVMSNVERWLGNNPQWVPTGETEEIELAGMSEAQARNYPNVRQREDGTWVMDREILEMQAAPEFQYDPDMNYLDIAHEEGFEGPRAFVAALSRAMFEPGPGDLWQIAALPWGRLVNRAGLRGVSQVLEDALSTRMAQNVVPGTEDAVTGFLDSAKRLANDPSLSEAVDRNGNPLGRRAEWLQGGHGYGNTFVVQTPGFRAIPTNDAQRGVQINFSVKRTPPDRNGVRYPYLYIHTLERNTPQMGQYSEIPTAVLDLADAWGLPVTTSPGAFGGDAVTRRHFQSGILYTEELEAMYNRLGFQRYNAITPEQQRLYGDADGRMFRFPAEAGVDPAVQARRAADLDGRIDQEIIDRGKRANERRLADEKAYKQANQNTATAQAINQAAPAAIPQDFFLRHDGSNTRSTFHLGTPPRQTVSTPQGSRAPNPRRVIADAVNQHSASDWLPTVYEEFLAANSLTNADLAGILANGDPQSVFGVASVPSSLGRAYLMNDLFPNSADQMRALGIPDNLVDEFFLALARVWGSR